MNLYPLKFAPLLKSVIWGGESIRTFKNLDTQQEQIGESWEISGVKDNVSVVANGPLKGKQLNELIAEFQDQLVGKRNYETFGETFPLLIKFIDALDNLSIQVHPDDKLAKKRHNSFGKTEMWYVMDAKPGSYLYSGFAQDMTPDLYVKSIEDNTFVDFLEKHEVKKGDVFFLPAGRVHAIGAGILIAEIQQTSDITYRIYDYNRKDAAGNGRELHTELAKDAIDYQLYDNYKTLYQPVKNEVVKLESCPYFTTNLLDLDKEMVRDYADIDSFVIYICMEGKADLEDNKGNKITLQQGESMLLPADIKTLKIQPKGKILLLESYK